VDQERAFSLTGDEWAIQAETGGASPKARAWGIAIYRLFGKEDPAVKQRDATINGVMLEIISQMARADDLF